MSPIVTKKLLNYVCVSNERFLKCINSGTNEDVVYEVRYDTMYVIESDEIVRQWRCECVGYITWHRRKKNYQCKHIKEVVKKHWCGWKQKEHGGQPIEHNGFPKEYSTDYTCWNCGRLAYLETDIA
jgi:hypothetical protein